MPNSPRVVLPFLVAALLSACSPSTESGPQAEAPAAAPPPAAAAAARRAAGQNVEWRFYGGNLASQRYSPLDQIDASNAGQLKIAWRFNTGNYGPRPEARNETTPLDDRRRALHAGRHHAQRRRARPEERRAAVGLAAERRRAALRARAAQDLGPRPRVLDATAPATSACSR